MIPSTSRTHVPTYKGWRITKEEYLEHCSLTRIALCVWIKVSFYLGDSRVSEYSELTGELVVAYNFAQGSGCFCGPREGTKEKTEVTSRCGGSRIDNSFIA